jgi:hypothetical protein
MTAAIISAFSRVVQDLPPGIVPVDDVVVVGRKKVGEEEGEEEK